MRTPTTTCRFAPKRLRACTTTAREPSVHGLQFGEHGLPLMGSGDWNDGMNLVGIHGKGESVWLGFFLFDVLREFRALADARGDPEFAERCREEGGAPQ